MASDPAIALGRDLADDASRTRRAPEPWSNGIVQALVAGVVPPLVTVRPQGLADSSADVDMPYLDSYDPAVGDVVIYGRISGSPFVVGRTKPKNDRQKAWREIIFPNGGDLTSATFVDFITGFTNIPVPGWAQDGTAKADIVINFQAAQITATTVAQVRAVAGSTNGTPSRVSSAGTPTTQFSGIAGISYTIPSLTTSIAIKLQGLRVVATGALRPASSVDTIAVCDALIHVP